MALCSFFFLIIILLLSPTALLPLGRSSRAEPVAVKLSALKGCLLSELYLSHMHQKYNLPTQTPAPVTEVTGSVDALILWGFIHRGPAFSLNKAGNPGVLALPAELCGARLLFSSSPPTRVF